MAQVFDEGDLLYAAMVRDIHRAKSTICLESYIFSGDEAGWLVARALISRAQAGVLVRVHLDTVGAWFEGSKAVADALLRAGVSLQWFNPYRLGGLRRLNQRNHRKLLVIDEACMYVGGFNIHRESSARIAGKHRWADVHVRIVGAIGRQAHWLFLRLWNHQRESKPPPWSGSVRLMPNQGYRCRRLLHCELLDVINAASSKIVVVTPYFVPDRRFRRALARARKRGVIVQVLLPHRLDSKLVQMASMAIVSPMMSQGIEFFTYQPRMLHAKMMLVDDSWATIGSANTDYRSFFVNLEINLFIRNKNLCSKLRDIFDKNMRSAIAIEKPIGRLSPLGRMGSLVAYWGRRFL